MAAVTHQLVTASTLNVSTYASGSFTPPAGELLVAFVTSTGTTDVADLTASANGITFALVDSGIRGASPDTTYCFIAEQLVPGSPSAMTVTFDCTGDAATGAIISVGSVSGMSKVGLAAVRQTTKVENGTAGTTPQVIFPAACLTGNPTLLGDSTTLSGGTTPPTNWTERADTSYSTPTTGGGYVSRNSGFTGTTVNWGSTAGVYTVLAVELDTTASTPVGSTDGTWAWAGTAAGTRASAGATAGTWAEVGAALGAATLKGTTAGTWAWVGVAPGKATLKGVAAGIWAWVGAAFGSAPVLGASGTTAGAWVWVGAALGKATKKGVGSGAWTWVGAAAGKVTQRGTAVGSWAFTGSALGKNAPHGTVLGAWSFIGTATGDASALDPIVHRPATGDITRPSTGTVTRASTGTVARPGTGTVTRPSTGTVTRPQTYA